MLKSRKSQEFYLSLFNLKPQEKESSISTVDLKKFFPEQQKFQTKISDFLANKMQSLEVDIQQSASESFFEVKKGPKFDLDKTIKHKLEGHTDLVFRLLTLDNFLFTASCDKTIKVWDLGLKTLRSTLVGH